MGQNKTKTHSYIFQVQLPCPIGIDLGTTFSAVAIYRGEKSEMIPNAFGDKLTPSCVFYNPNISEILVGKIAEERGLTNPENFIFDIKRFIGRRYDDVYVQKLKNSEEYPFKIVEGNNGQTEIKLRCGKEIVKKSPEEICSEILKNMKESASEYLGTTVTEAVISVPAYFSNAQKKATKAAAKLAGLKVLKLITEPVAAAIHYAQDKLDTDSTLLVFDLGGGTLDVSIIKVNGHSFAVQSVEGDSFLGGRDFDEMLVNYFKPTIKEKLKNKSNIVNERLLRRIQRNCEKLKKLLSVARDHSFDLYYSEDDSIKLELSQTQFNQLIDNSVERSAEIIRKCLADAELTTGSITDVILVGGSTRIPRIREKLTSMFGSNKIRTNLNPDEAVALGASIQAGVFGNRYKELEKYQVKEATPLSLGLEVSGNLMKILIEKNSSLPKKSNPNRYRTMTNNQTSAVFPIYEGERKNCKYNNLLGEFTIDDLPLGQAGEISFEVVFHLDENGILEVSAQETSTCKHNKLTVTLGEFQLGVRKIERTIAHAKQHKKDDEMFESFTIYFCKVREICERIIYNLEKINSNTDRCIVESECTKFWKTIEALQYTEILRLKYAYSSFKMKVSPLTAGVIDVNFIA
ncbi:hypothetical protein HUJ05_001817 [Dendroctonus ponderosae]|nr:hypothetical protein HUJ05_001817 [Dendroctonus ponderosae]